MFDPYLDWLNIPADRRPPSHYDLLGVDPAEPDLEEIHRATMQRMALVRRYQLGEHAETVTRVLGELSTAYACLSDADRRAAYDERVKGPSAAEAVRPEQQQIVDKASVQSRRSKPLVAWALCGIAVAALVFWLARQQQEPADSANPVQSSSLQRVGKMNAEPHLEALPPSPNPDAPVMAVAEGQTAAGMPVRQGKHPHLRYFGISTAGPARVIETIEPFTNVVLIGDCVNRRNDALAAAKEAGLPIVLCVVGGEIREAGAPARLRHVLGAYSQSILAVCWLRPYFRGFKPADVANLGQAVKEAHPKIQFWLGCNDVPWGEAFDYPVPDVVDVLLIHEVADDTPELVRAKGDAVLPGWLEKSGGRPLVWCWSPVSKHPRGLVPTTASGTFRACMELALRYQLAGLVFERFGDPRGQERIPIDARPHLAEEVREIAGELGFDKAPSSRSSSGHREVSDSRP